LNLINGYPRLLKIEEGYLKLEKIDSTCPRPSASAADLLALKAQSKGIELLTLGAPRQCPTCSVATPTACCQILINLGNNAIKFTEKGQIVIHCQVDSVRDNDLCCTSCLRHRRRPQAGQAGHHLREV
jgi:signal transduction histidine kinase